MATVADLLSTKGDGINYFIESTENIMKALEVMAEADISSVMVT